MRSRLRPLVLRGGDEFRELVQVCIVQNVVGNRFRQFYSVRSVRMVMEACKLAISRNSFGKDVKRLCYGGPLLRTRIVAWNHFCEKRRENVSLGGMTAWV